MFAFVNRKKGEKHCSNSLLKKQFTMHREDQPPQPSTCQFSMTMAVNTFFKYISPKVYQFVLKKDKELKGVNL